MLPVEFARQSGDERLALVVCEGVPLQRTLWAKSVYTELQQVVENLRAREGTVDRHIHYATKDGASRPDEGIVVDIMQKWLMERTALDAAVWTGLPPKFNGQERVPSPEEAIEYLRNLYGPSQFLAEEYVRKTPEMIQTVIRKEAEDRLGWLPIPLSPGTVADE
jgi:hypothetical protein